MKILFWQIFRANSSKNIGETSDIVIIFSNFYKILKKRISNVNLVWKYLLKEIDKLVPNI